MGAPESICSQVNQVMLGAGNRAALEGTPGETLSVRGNRGESWLDRAFLRGFLAQWYKVEGSGSKW